MKLAIGMVVLAGAVAVAEPSAYADIIIYRIPKTNMVVLLEGSSSVNPGGTINYRHSKFSRTKLVLSLDDAQRFVAPSPRDVFRKKLAKAISTGDAEQTMAAADWALRHGLLDKFYDAVVESLKLDASHARAIAVKELKQKILQPIEFSAEHEQHMKKVVPVSGMRFKRSAHFLLMHDTPDTVGEYRRKSRADERLELLELVYESFLLRFFAHGIELDVPAEPLMVVLFNNEPDFREYSVKLSPELASAAGFWSSKTNISIFYDHGTTAEFLAVRAMAKDFRRMAEDVKKNRRAFAPGEAAKVVRMSEALSLLVEISQENSDIEVVSHEVTHQMAGNTGLLPRGVMVPAWMHEGLATYFEAPKEAAWSGIGAVNDTRLEWYRELANDREHSNIDFIVGDQIFKNAASGGATLHAYGQAWAMTHFLMERRFEQLMKFYRRVGEMPADIIFSPTFLTRLFSESFGQDRAALELEWRAYMRGLKTDLELFLEDAR